MVVDGRTLRAIKARCTIFIENDAPAFRIGECGVVVVFESGMLCYVVLCFLMVWFALVYVDVYCVKGREAMEGLAAVRLFFNKKRYCNNEGISCQDQDRHDRSRLFSS